ncbi:MAG: hypothetical protein HFJ40_02005 [Clostridia bacterium]|nr:hypothetical protein [Clostridia bacterium]
MCRVGLIDDIKDEYEDYKYRLELRDIELIYMDFKTSYDEILEWILDSGIEVLLIDYKLDLLYEFNGSRLFQFINNNIPDLQCILFTSNPEDDDLVIKMLKVNKNVFTSDEKFNEFVDMLKQAAKVFKNRKNESITEYEELLSKKEKGILELNEKKRFVELHRRLVSIGIIENIPERLLEADFEKAVDDLIKNVEDYVKREDKDGV